MNKAFVSCLGLLSALVVFEFGQGGRRPVQTEERTCRRAGAGRAAASSANPDQQLVGWPTRRLQRCKFGEQWFC